MYRMWATSVSYTHLHAVNSHVQELRNSRARPAGRKPVNDKQIHPQVVQLAFIESHLRAVLMAPAVLIDDAGRKVIESLPAPEAVWFQQFQPLRQLPPHHLSLIHI